MCIIPCDVPVALQSWEVVEVPFILNQASQQQGWGSNPLCMVPQLQSSLQPSLLQGSSHIPTFALSSC